MKFGHRVTLYSGKLYGYDFPYVHAAQAAFMAEFKRCVPVKMFDPGTKIWWIPDIYCTIAESIALNHGILTKNDLKLVAGHRASYMHGEKTLETDFKTLGLQPGAPYKLAETAYFYWRGALAVQPLATLEAQEVEEAWQRIKAHFEAEAQRDPPPIPTMLPVMR